MKKFTHTATVAKIFAMIAVLIALMVLAAPSAHAQAITINGASCPTATIVLSSAGVATTIPVTCSGNGNVCVGATVTFSTNGIIVNAPAACFVGAPLTPTISGMSTASAYAGQTVTLIGTNFATGTSVTVGGVAAIVQNVTGSTLSFTVPAVATGMQPVIVTARGLSALTTLNIILAPAPIALLAAKSRKVHAAAGIFDITIDTTQAINGLVTVEPRVIGTGHVIVFQFDAAITAVGNASVVDSQGASQSASVQQSGNDIAVTLLNATDISRVKVTLTGVNGSGSASASLGFLLGDVNNSRSVNSSDISGVKARSGQITDASNFKYDVNTSGAINSSDISTFKARSGNTLP